MRRRPPWSGRAPGGRYAWAIRSPSPSPRSSPPAAARTWSLRTRIRHPSSVMAKKGKRKLASGDVASNRRASHKYEFVEKFEAGLELVGSEVKSLRSGKAALADAYAVVSDGEVWLRNMHIPPYPPAAGENHEPDRPRKLLLHGYEIERLVG